MTTIFVWILISYTGSSYRLVYSPPVATEESCKVLLSAAKDRGDYHRCVKVEVYK